MATPPSDAEDPRSPDGPPSEATTGGPRSGAPLRRASAYTTGETASPPPLPAADPSSGAVVGPPNGPAAPEIIVIEEQEAATRVGLDGALQGSDAPPEVFEPRAPPLPGEGAGSARGSAWASGSGRGLSMDAGARGEGGLEPGTPTVETFRRFRAGHVLNGKYRLERMVAKGGMGCVYLANQIPLGRKVAIKILIPQSFDEEFRRRFFLEASISARLSHRHIVTVHDYGETEDGDLFMAMEFLNGEPLSRVIAREVRLPPDRACLIGIQTARALRSAHRAGVVHRDLKPSNIMLLPEEEEEHSSDFVKVLDFGLVKVFEEGRSDSAESDDIDLTRAGTMLGSPRYMAPEQIRCQSVDPRTDIYSLGVILFHMIAGRPPFIGQGSVEILNHHLRSPAPPIEEVAPEANCPPELEVIVQRCLSKRPADRYASMDDLLGELKAAYRLVSDVPIWHETSVALVEEEHRRPSLSGAENRTPSRILPSMEVEGSGPSLEQILTGELPSPHLASADSLGSVTAAAPIRRTRVFEPNEIPDLRPRRRWALAVVFLAVAGLVGGAGFALVRIARVAVPAPAEVAWVEVTLTSQPAGAMIWLEGRPVGTTPLQTRLPRLTTGSARDFVFQAEGFEDAVLSGRLDLESLQLHASLRRARAIGAKDEDAPTPRAAAQESEALKPVPSSEEAEPEAVQRSPRRPPSSRPPPRRPSRRPEPVRRAAASPEPAAPSPPDEAAQPASEPTPPVVAPEVRSLIVDDPKSSSVRSGSVPIVD